jgi:CubicO group peptidase (beta-lactamase class C family)
MALILTSIAPASPAADPGLRGEMEAILAEEQLVGIAWAMVNSDGVVSVDAAGLRDNRNQVDFTVGTRLHVGSITKTLVATGVLRLATSGAIDLDAPVTRYLPDLAFENPWGERSPVTVRHLLDHTAGLDDARLWQMFSENAEPNTPLASTFAQATSLLEIRSEPGSQFSYSNMGYTLLGMVIETVTGERYEAYLDANLLAPLSMHNSTFEFTTQEGAERDPTLAWGHVDDGSRYPAAPIFLRPAGQFTTTVGDMATFASFLMGDGTLNGTRFIDQSLMNSRGIPTGTRAADQGLIAGYALGLGRRDRHGVISYCHGGNIVGFSAMLCLYPDQGKAFFYSVNTDSETADYSRFQSRLIEALAIEEASEPPTSQPAADIADWHGYYILSPGRFAMFEYLDTVFGYIRISDDAGMLAMTSLQQDSRTLRPLGGYAFSANDRATQSHVFLRQNEGGYLISDGFQTYQKVSALYLIAHWASVLLGLAGMIWLALAGLYSLIRHPGKLLAKPEAPAFIAICLLALPVPFFLGQSFMALGDFTLASGLLALVTLILPIGMILTIARAMLTDGNAALRTLHGIMAVFVLQWCVVLAGAGLLPMRLWA